MFYVFSYLPTATITEPSAYELEMRLPNGVIHQVDVLFQDGCNHETFVQVFHDNYQVWPSNRGEKLRGNATVVSFREFYELKKGDNILTAKIWTSLAASWKELIVQIGVLPKRIIQPMSFDELSSACGYSMSPNGERPPGRGPTVDYFKLDPVWAKQSFAYRLLHTLVPKVLSRRLPKTLRLALVAPGVVVPPGVVLPPGTVVQPGAEIPPGWTAGDPQPPGVIPAPSLPAGDLPGGAFPPTFVSPWEPGPSTQPGKQPAPSIVYYFQEPFDDLTTNSWTDKSVFGGTATVVSGELEMIAGGGSARAWVERTHGVAWPTNWTVSLSLNFQSGSGIVRIELYTGTYRTRLWWTPPNQVNILPISGSCEAIVANYLGTSVVWSLKVTGNLATLSMNGVPVISGCGLYGSSTTPLLMKIEGYSTSSSLLDYLNITID